MEEIQPLPATGQSNLASRTQRAVGKNDGKAGQWWQNVCHSQMQMNCALMVTYREKMSRKNPKAAQLQVLRLNDL